MVVLAEGSERIFGQARNFRLLPVRYDGRGPYA
jgi:hypothetical protein